MTNELHHIDQIKQRNAEAGFFFFAKDTMRFFASRALSEVHPVPGGAVFVTSEKKCFDDPIRTFTIRRIEESGEIATLSTFGEFSTARRALTAARKLAEQIRTNEGADA